MISRCPRCGYETLWARCPACVGRSTRPPKRGRIRKPKVEPVKWKVDRTAMTIIKVLAHFAGKGKQKADEYGIIRGNG